MPTPRITTTTTVLLDNNNSTRPNTTNEHVRMVMVPAAPAPKNSLNKREYTNLQRPPNRRCAIRSAGGSATTPSARRRATRCATRVSVRLSATRVLVRNAKSSVKNRSVPSGAPRNSVRRENAQSVRLSALLPNAALSAPRRHRSVPRCAPRRSADSLAISLWNARVQSVNLYARRRIVPLGKRPGMNSPRPIAVRARPLL